MGAESDKQFLYLYVVQERPVQRISIVPSLTKIWIVRHFQGNYFKITKNIEIGSEGTGKE